MSFSKVKKRRAELADFDITEEVQRWGMYSYERPAYTLWNAVGLELFNQGWTMEEIKALLRSKYTRWGLDGNLGSGLDAIAQEWAQSMLKCRAEVQTWIEKGDY